MLDQATSRSDAYVHADGVQKIFNPGPKQTLAVGGIDCRVKEGEFVSLLGPSGCGKSTLLSILGLTHSSKSASTFRLLDWDIQKTDQATKSTLRRKHIGHVLQNGGLIYIQ